MFPYVLAKMKSQTLTLPKPLVEFANRPMIEHQIESLANAGVTDIVLAVNYRPEVMAEALKEVGHCALLGPAVLLNCEDG